MLRNRKQKRSIHLKWALNVLPPHPPPPSFCKKFFIKCACFYLAFQMWHFQICKCIWTHETRLELFFSFVLRLLSAHIPSLGSPCRRLLWPTGCWSRTGVRCTARPRWTCAPGSLAPWAPWRTWSGNLCRPPRSLAAAALCLGGIKHISHKTSNDLFFFFLHLHFCKRDMRLNGNIINYIFCFRNIQIQRYRGLQKPAMP